MNKRKPLIMTGESQYSNGKTWWSVTDGTNKYLVQRLRESDWIIDHIAMQLEKMDIVPLLLTDEDIKSLDVNYGKKEDERKSIPRPTMISRTSGRGGGGWWDCMCVNDDDL